MSSKFISKKLIKELKTSNKFSKPIIRVSIASIAISILVMIISISIVKGFQKEIKHKVVNFSSHFQITAGGNNFSFENSPIIMDKKFMESLRSDSEIKHIQTFATKPGLIQSKADTQNLNEDRIKIIRDIEGVIFKGINTDYNWNFLSEKIIEGSSFTIKPNQENDSILISKYLSKKLKLAVNTPIACYFIKGNGPKPKRFIVAGIYETGLEEFDKQFAFIDIKHIQSLNDWGIETNLFLNEKTNENGELVIRSFTSGESGDYTYEWNGKKSFNKEFTISKLPKGKTTIQLVAKEYNPSFRENETQNPKTDTAYLTIHANVPFNANNYINKSFDYESINDSTRTYKSDNLTLTSTLFTTGGSKNKFIGGYEVFIEDFDKIDDVENILYLKSDPLQKISKITSLYKEIFGWLSILDTNVIVIIILMIVVSIINIISLMLVLIIERSNMIGLLKAFGAKNFTIQRVFISLGGYMLIRGLIIGNVIAFALIFLQQQFGILKLPQENYYLSEVPMSMEVFYFIFINALTIAISYGILFFISLFISSIKPIKSIKFD